MNSSIRPVTEFYNSIAPEYDQHMTDADKKARDSVHDLFKQYVSPGDIMDFGGGTGLDTSWLGNNGYKVFFVEPSTSMRSVARGNGATNRVDFIESNTDFAGWTQNNLPFPQKVNGILANFAVLNCIEDIDLLFEKLALVSAGNCYVVATVIDPGFTNMTKHYSPFAAIKMLLRSKLTIYNKYKEQFHPTYIHSIKALEKAGSKYFQLVSITSLDVTSFAVLIFKKK